VSAEVVDLRTIRPLDVETIVSSIVKTGRLVVVEEGPRTGGWAAEVVAVAVEHAMGDLDDIWRITSPNSPIPYSPAMEDAFLPGAARIADEVMARA
jgi:pyruvate/2-oxoglutarate/acetoin dehydrogenase E1 component